VQGALAFFVLARRLDDALHLLLGNLAEMHLAVVLVRLAAVSPQEETILLHSLLTDTVIPFAEARGDRGLLHLCFWRLSRPAAAAAAMWIRIPSSSHLAAVESKLASVSRTGLLSRLTAAAEDATGSGQGASEEAVCSRVHPATIALIATMTSRYPHLRGMWVPVPREPLCIAVVRSLLADGCAGLAEPILASLRQSGDGELSGRAVREGELDALCISVCLAKATELIRAEGSRHAGWWWGTQVDLSRIIRLLRGIVASLSVDIAAVSQLLVRFASYM